MVGVAELPELPALAALKVSCAANDETPPARTRSARYSRAAFPDAGAKGSFDKNDASGAASRDDSPFEFAGTSPTPATFGVSPLSASPVPGDARWNLGAVGTSAKGPRTKISPVSVLTVSALDLSVSFEDEDDDDAMDVSRDVSRVGSREECRGGGAFGDETHKNSAVGSDRAFSRGNATFGASASFKLDQATDAKTSATPLASPVAAHPSAGFGTPANVALVGGVGFGPFDAVPPTPARPRRLDAFDDEDDLAFGDAPEDDEDAWRLSDDSEELTEMDAIDAEMDDAPLPFSLAALDGEPDTNHGAAGGVARAAAAATRETVFSRERSTRTRWTRRPPARRKEPLPFRAPRLERADSLSQTKLLAQEGLHRSASLRADYHHRETESAPSERTVAEMAPGVSATTTTTTTRDESRVSEDFERTSRPAIGSAEASPSKARAFAFHDHFEFRGLLGKTSTSEAWLVRSKVSGARYCVKRVTEAFRSGAQRARCLHEVQAVTHLPFHENVVQYHRAWQEDRHFFAQMELCERGSFGACLDRLRAHDPEDRDRDPFQTRSDPFRTKEEEEEGISSETVTRLVAERDVWRLARDVASGLAHCHAHGVLHLDVKPDNVFVARDGAYKIGDFGVAWVAGRGWEVQDGDGGYVAPETLNLHSAFFVKKVGSAESGDDDRGDANASVPTDRADVFSFGATLYEAACGARVPAEWRAGVPTWSDETANGANGVLKTTQKKKDDETRPRRYWDGLRFPAGRSDELRAYVSMCLRRDPTHRPSAADLAKHAAMIERTFVFGANARESGAARGE